MTYSGRDWYGQLADIVDHLGSESFTERLMAALTGRIPVDQSMIIAFHRDSAPSILFADVDEPLRRAVVDSYVQGPYLLDPWYELVKRQASGGLYMLKEVAPDNFFSSEYYLTYYRDTRLKNEAVYLVPLDDGAQLQISMGFYSTALGGSVVQALRTIEPLILSLSRRHWGPGSALAGDGNAERAAVHHRVSSVFQSFGASVLTERERQLALMILRGYSLKASAESLGIAMGTVKVHCKNLYQKLGITSQAELFSLFIDALTMPGSPEDGDPLRYCLMSKSGR
ncbi:MAG: helix-turn-helix transcriptional regulator [Oceanospirillaceae bacterium]|nr:helix-turn-helix transcriptional regulator [Oceanospirillaceae bacterium]